MTKFLTSRFEEALIYANRLHGEQVRKGSNVPYISHLLSVSAIVLEYGGDEDQAIAALLHDAIEDQGGDPVRQTIRQKFGDRVAMMVEGCTDSDTIPKSPWKQRKMAYIKRFRQETSEIRLVALADKLHNARSILADYQRIGEEIWTRFTGKKEQTLWYYRTLIEAAKDAGDNPFLVNELEQVVQQLESL